MYNIANFNSTSFVLYKLWGAISKTSKDKKNSHLINTEKVGEAVNRVLRKEHSLFLKAHSMICPGILVQNTGKRCGCA